MAEDCTSVPNFGMAVPRGGSSCAKCRYLETREGRPFCRNDDFIRFLGVRPESTSAVHIPAPDDDPGRYCCNAFSPSADFMLASAKGSKDGSGNAAPAAVTLDLGMDDVHIPSVPTKAPRTRTMSKLTTRQRKAIPKGQFADPENKAYPIHNAAHVRNAAARLEQQKGSMAPEKYRSIRRNIARAARKFGIKSEYNTKTARMRGRGMRLSLDHPQHGRLEVRTMSAGPGGVFYLAPLSAAIDPESAPGQTAVALDDAGGSPKRLVWNQLAEVGQFKGHPAGPFELTPRVFAEIVSNFEREHIPIPIDAEHASEAPGTQGSVPVVGAPAMGWIHQLDNRGDGGLWGLVEWLEPARSYIKEGRYRFISPAVRFNSRDPKTGSPIGARLSSAGITNTPFLKSMQQLAAKDNAMTTQATESVVLSSRYVHAAADYMPRIRAALKLPDIATAKMCSDHLGMLRDHFESAGNDPNAVHEGVRLSDYMGALRDGLGVPMGMTYEEMLDLVEDMIEAAMDEHVAEYHSPEEVGASYSDAAPQETTMTDKELTTQLTEAKAQVITLTDKVTSAESATAKLSLQLKDSDAKIGELTARIAALETENKNLKEEQAKQTDKLLSDKVETAFVTYKDAKKLTDDDKRAMLITLKSDAALFDKLYPAVAPQRQHLLRDLANTRPGNAESTVPNTAAVPDMKTLTDKFVKEGKSIEEAVSLAYKTINEQLSQPVA